MPKRTDELEEKIRQLEGVLRAKDEEGLKQEKLYMELEVLIKMLLLLLATHTTPFDLLEKVTEAATLTDARVSEKTYKWFAEVVKASYSRIVDMCADDRTPSYVWTSDDDD